jgi:CelD/BcsL family acetyltransferase involved in cellulose biosynthesis
MKVIDINPCKNPVWELLLSKYNSDVFHSPHWLRGIANTYDFNIRALVIVDEENRPLAGIAYHQAEAMLGSRISSLPFSDFADPLVKTAEEWNVLATELLNKNQEVTFKCLHNDIPLNDSRLTVAGHAKWHCINLETDADVLWNNIHSTGRRAIRKAQNNKITTRIAESKKELRAFFELHLRIRKYKYHLLAQPYAFFENIWDNFVEQGNGALFLAIHDGQIIGGVFFLVWNNRFYYKFNASDASNIELRPNDLVIWEASKYGINKGYFYLDLGLSSIEQEGLIRYKRKFSTDEKTITFLKSASVDASSEVPRQLRVLLPQLTKLFVAESIPDEITEKSGELLYRYFA